MYRDDAEAAAARAAALEEDLTTVRAERAADAARLAELRAAIAAADAEIHRLKAPQRQRLRVAIGLAILCVVPATIVGARGGCREPAADACSSGSECFDKGLAAGKNHYWETARRLYLRGCNSGHAWSCTNLGWMYQQGNGVPADRAVAALLYRVACADGDELGCKNREEVEEHP